mgnify:CR=1 FL=1
MKRKWSLRLGAAVLCAVLLGSCGSTAAAPAESTAPADPLTGQQLLYPELEHLGKDSRRCVFMILFRLLFPGGFRIFFQRLCCRRFHRFQQLFRANRLYAMQCVFNSGTDCKRNVPLLQILLEK